VIKSVRILGQFQRLCIHHLFYFS